MSEQRNIDSIYPLSPMQQGMLFHTLLAPKSGVYFNQILYTLTGCLQKAAMQRAWQQVVDRHEALRTLFVWEAREKPLQVVRRRVTLPWEELDWCGLSADEQDAKLAALLQADRRRGFDLTRAPLMRLALIRLGENHHELIWSHHHLLFEGWSSFLILKDVMAIYQALSEGRDCRLEPVRPYRDYIKWLQRQDSSKAEGFWRAALKGFAAPTPLLGSPRPGEHEVQDYEIAEQLGSTPPSLTAALKSFARQNDLTLGTIVQGAWAILLSRYSGETDVVFGSTVSGRSAELVGIESMVGLFINSLPVRAQFSPQVATLAWLKDFQDKLVEMRQYEHSPLVDVQGWSEVRRDHPLFQSLVVFENHPVDASVWGQDGTLQISNMRVVAPTNYPLAIAVVPRTELSIRVRYDSRRFDRAAISRMLGHLNALLEGILSNPDQQLSDLSMLSEGERHQLLVEWNQTQQDFPRSKCIHELVEEQAGHTPEAVAVVFEKQQLSYRELNERANQLAHHLQKLGVGPDTLVGICLERSLEMVVGLLGILKAGGAYVPLDPGYPKERLAFMVHDSGASVLLTHRGLRDQLQVENPNCQILCLDADSGTIARSPTRNPISGVGPENLAYAIYTSGSTGRPKGVMNTHRGICNRLLWMQETYQLTMDERVLQKTPFTFDVSVWEFFWPLLTGARLVVARPRLHGDSQYLIRVICENAITTLHLVPSMLAAFLEDKHAARCSSLRRVICSGEALHFELQERFFSTLPDTQLHNLYGPTEAAVDVTFWRCQRGSSEPIVPIGRPVANTQAYILDGAMQPVPPGVTGELHIGGVQLARGYLGRPELTAEKFVQNPFGEGRLYKTGDLARYRSDGAIEFLGRIDNQVKIRGFRIELGEIETVLRQHPSVQESVVIAREDIPRDRRLVAYVVARDHTPGDERLTAHAVSRNGAASLSELREFLRVKLPDYMVPAAFVPLQALPLTPNGKVDRKALPKPDFGTGADESKFVAPGTPTEIALARIWCKALGLKQVGIHDNFFELGGHSLLALRIFSEIEKMFGDRPPLATLFQAPTIEKLATVLDDRSWKAALSPVVAVQRSGLRPPFFGVHGGYGDVMFYSELARCLGKDQPFYALQAEGLKLCAMRCTSIEAIASYYLQEIRQIQAHGPYFLGGFCLGGVIALETARLLRAAGEEVALLVLFDTSNPARPIPLSTVGKRIRLALDESSGLPPSEKLRYIARRFAAKFKRDAARVQKARYKILELLHKTRKPDGENANGGPLPLELPVWITLGRAAAKYKPRAYPGRIVLFRATVPDGHEFADDRGWTEVAEGGLEIHDIPGKHGTMFEQRHAAVGAEKLAAYIQAKLSR